MKVLFISSDNNSTSGAFLSMVRLNEILNHIYGVQTKIILPKKGDGEDILIKAGIDYEYIYSYSWIIRREKNISNFIRSIIKWLLQCINLIAIKKIQNIIKRENIDIVHINTTFSYVGAKAALKEHVKLVWHLREFLEEDRNLKILNRRKGYKLINSADKIIAISESIYQKYLHIFSPNRLLTVYNGISVEEFYNKKKIFLDDIFHFVIVGKVSLEKGQIDLIQACALLKKEKVKFQLNIVGDIDFVYKKELDKIIKKAQINQYINFVGKQKDVKKFLKTADIAFMCSKNEAFGRVTVEAMLSGCLVVGADTSGTLEILQGGNYGIVYKQGNAFDLTEKILYINSHREKMKQLALEAQNYAMSNFSAVKNAKQIYDIYSAIIDN